MDSAEKRQSRRRSNAYGRMFTAFTAGASLVVTGIIGLDIGHMRGAFAGTRWVSGPVWWQIALGSGLLLLGLYWSRRLGGTGWTSIPAPRQLIIKDVGAGKSPGAARTEVRRNLPSGQSKP